MVQIKKALVSGIIFNKEAQIGIGHCYLDMDNNYRCELKKYPESNIVCRNWGQWKVDADKCSNYK